MLQKHFRFSKKDCANIKKIKQKYQAESENQACRIAVRIAAKFENVGKGLKMSAEQEKVAV